MSTKPPPVPPAPLAMSPTKMDTANCPHRYQALFIKGEKDTWTEDILQLGGLVHEVAADYVRHLVDSKQHSDHAALRRIGESAWQNRGAGIPEGLVDDYGLFIYSQLHKFTIDPATVVGVEWAVAVREDFTVCDFMDDDVAYGGILDLVYRPEPDTIAIRDWTTAALAGKFGPKKELQLRFYGLMACLACGADRVQITAHSLRTGAQKTLTLDADENEATVERIVSERRRIQQRAKDNDWPAIPGSQCGICSIDCPYEVETGKRTRIVDDDDAAKVHQALIWLERQRKELTAVLKRHVGVNGSVVSSGVEARMQTVDRWTYDSNAVYQELRDQGFSQPEILAAFNLDRAAVKKMLKSDDAFRDLERFAENNATERFYPCASVKAD